MENRRRQASHFISFIQRIIQNRIYIKLFIYLIQTLNQKYNVFQNYITTRIKQVLLSAIFIYQLYLRL